MNRKKPTPNPSLKGGEQGPRLDASLLEEERYKYYDPFVEGSY